ncbi:hypothetical protein [Agrobacterium tumefaciens]|uniref:Lipoprotein n=1 Tax=Agrobacterium tumefaciens TaxID=358 RepID=A0AA44F8R6_AGRTU|nr:hypothetical protein [Agrobacterium tumefaciens]NSL25099.1 hypothetical protein [Agrobacterium tumefaciens]NTB86752.1 hypothetical protein [Agrobacterium tumefaciens]NTC21081.1 hypothetical protein [Agrobacterium tumefaciens]NTC30629.1 hypothetical protein [Agrobacterium tumefaciens]NTC57709.1 hypothetical protein [Agrobacterium tumefaciens]
MKSRIALLCLILLTSCQTVEKADSRFALSNKSGPAFKVTGRSAVSPEQLKKDMTSRAAQEAQRRGYPVVVLVNNSPVRTENGLHTMTATYMGLSSFAEAGKRQALDVNSSLETDSVSGRRQTTNPSKYGGGLFLPSTAEGRAADATMKAVSETLF